MALSVNLFSIILVENKSHLIIAESIVIGEHPTHQWDRNNPEVFISQPPEQTMSASEFKVSYILDFPILYVPDHVDSLCEVFI